MRETTKSILVKGVMAMEQSILEAFERAIGQVVTDFQGQPDRYWNERDLHWSLFHYLRQEGAVPEDYPTQLIRAEFPTIKTYDGERPARGHYDLVVLDPTTYFSDSVQNLSPSDSWAKSLPLMKVLIAVEVKLWLAKPQSGRAEWDIQKLTDPDNNIGHPYFLNFVDLPFGRPYARNYYEDLRQWFATQAKASPYIRILYVPSRESIQQNPNDNWVSPHRPRD